MEYNKKSETGAVHLAKEQKTTPLMTDFTVFLKACTSVCVRKGERHHRSMSSVDCECGFAMQVLALPSDFDDAKVWQRGLCMDITPMLLSKSGGLQWWEINVNFTFRSRHVIPYGNLCPDP
eukprot:1301733-Amphidinium_carterae.1